MHPSTALGSQVIAAPAGNSNTAGAPILIVAAAGTDNVERTGPTVARFVAGHGLADSCTLEIAGLFTLAAGATCSYRVQIQEQNETTGAWGASEELLSLVNGLAGTGPGGGGNVICDLSLDLNLRGRTPNVRFLITCDLSAGGADTGFYAAKAILGGFSVTPV